MSGGGVEVSGGAVLAVVAVAAGAFFVWRASSAVGGVAGSIGQALSGAVNAVRDAGASVYNGAQSAVSAVGGNAYTNPAAYTVPSGYTADWWAGGAIKPVESSQAYQADVRRIDNAIESNTSGGGYFFPLIDFSKL